jgi:hypothetical protein
MRVITARIRDSRFVRLLAIAPLILAGLLYFSRAYGAELPNRSVQLSSSRAGATATYQLGFDIPGAETLGSIQLQICANTPLIGDPCPPPAGFDISTATLSAQSGETGFSILPAGTNANTLVLSRAPAPASAGTVSYTLDGVINPSGTGSFYGRLQTFASNDASGPENDQGGVALSISSAVNISATVPPFLLLCVGVIIPSFDCSTASGDYINFGNAQSTAADSAESQWLTATNGANGYTVQVSGTTMTSGNDTINALSVDDVSRPGVSQFGLNLAANTSPPVGASPQGPGSAVAASGYNVPDFFKFVPGDILAGAPTADDYKKFTVSYLLNIPHGQPPGVYVSTLQYICLASF